MVTGACAAATSRPNRLHGEFVSGNYFSTLGIGAYAGRMFTDSDDTPVRRAHRRAQLPGVAERILPAIPPSSAPRSIIQARPFTVIGIAPPGFFGDRVSRYAARFLDAASNRTLCARRRVRSSIITESHWLYPLGSVRPGTNIGALQAKLSVAAAPVALHAVRAHRQWRRGHDSHQHVVLSPGGGGIQNLQQQTGKGLKMLMILSSVVLLIACANIANLMLARATTRRAEIARAHGPRRGPPPRHPPDSYRECAA